MKIKLVVLAVVLGVFVLPHASWAIYQYCTSCPVLGPTANCTCPGTGPHFIFTKCNNYPAGCQLQLQSSANRPSAKDAFLASLAVPAAASFSPAR